MDRIYYLFQKNSILLFSRISGQISIRCNPSFSNGIYDNYTKCTLKIKEKYFLQKAFYALAFLQGPEVKPRLHEQFAQYKSVYINNRYTKRTYYCTKRNRCCKVLGSNLITLSLTSSESSASSSSESEGKSHSSSVGSCSP